MWAAIGTIIGLLSPWIIVRRHRLAIESACGQTLSVPRRSVNIRLKVDSYRGVTISPHLEMCAVAEEQRGRRFLATDAPELPLPGCDVRKCGCRYRQHEDRRDEEDRRSGFGQMNEISQRLGVNEKRLAGNADRRRTVSKAEPAAYFNNY